MMKLLLIVEDITIGGGLERVVVNLANAFVQHLGYEVCVCSCFKQGEKPAYELDSRVQLRYLYRIDGASRLLRARRSRLYKLYLRSIFERVLSARVCYLALDFDFLIDNYHIYLPPAFLRPSCFPKSIKVFHSPFRRPRARAKSFDAVVVLSARQLPLWRAHYRHVEVIPNFYQEPSPRICDYDAPVVLSVGRMAEGDQKGFFRLVDIWELVQARGDFPTWQLCIVGEGEMKPKLEAKILAKGLESSVRVRPFTSAIGEEYARASIYAMSSYYEALPMVLLEAGGAGLVLIAFDVDTGPSDVIDSRADLVENGDLQSFANRLCELMRDRDLREELGKRARESIQEKFAKGTVLRQWRELFSRLKQGG